jgi:prepilin-type processing-associated H-X9-DG protein
MLLPALSKARDKAKDISCKNNLSSLAKVFMFYVQDNDGFMPLYGNTAWPGSVIGGHGWLVSTYPYLSNVSDKVTAIRTLYANMGVTRCPSDPDGLRTFNYNTSYIWDEDTVTGRVFGKRLSSIKNPSSHRILKEFIYLSPTDYMYRPHNGFLNGNYIDGHVKQTVQ